MDVHIDPEAHAAVNQNLINKHLTQTGAPFQATKLDPRLVVRERGVITIMTTESYATANGFIEGVPLYRKIILRLHLNLRTNGFLGQIISLLQGVGVRPLIVAGFYFDTIYVPVSRLVVAIDILMIMKSIAVVECTKEPWEVEFVDTEGFEFQDLPA